MKAYYCENCNGFVNHKKKYLGAVVGNLLLFPIVLMAGTGIPIKRICKRCETKVKKKKMHGHELFLPDGIYGNKKEPNNINSDVPIFGIISLVFNLVNLIILLSLRFSMLSFAALPISIIAVICAGAGLDKDNMRGVAKLGLFFGIILLLVSLWPIFFIGVYISAGGW